MIYLYSYLRLFGKKLTSHSSIFIMAFLVFGVQFVSAQTTVVTIGTGTTETGTTSASPINNFYESLHMQIVYPASAITAAGVTGARYIDSLAWDVVTAPTYALPNYKVQLKNTTATTATTYDATGLTTVVTYPVGGYTAVANSFTSFIVFTTPFLWDGSSNILIDICWEPSFDYSLTGTVKSSFEASSIGFVRTDGISECGVSFNSTSTDKPNIKLSFRTPAPCSGTPTAGTVAGPASLCPTAPFVLTTSGTTSGLSGLAYQWQTSSTATGPWSDVAGATGISYSSTGITTNTYYRLKTSCSGGTAVFTAAYLVNLAPNLPGGTYTINSSLATSGTNYASFTAAIAAMSCGIAGPVIFNVNAAAGPYVELVNITNILGTSPTNTIRFNGNGATVQFTNTLAQRQLLVLDGAKYVTFDSITFKSLDATYGWGALITNGAYNDSIKRCTFNLTSVTGTSSVNSNGITFSAINTSPTSSAPTGSFNGRKCYVGGNKILGTTGTGGPYYALTLYTSDSNYVEKNLIQNFYYYGLYLYNANYTTIDKNEVQRATKTAVTTFYGLYMSGQAYGTRITNNRIHSAKAPTATGTGSQYGIYSFATGLSTARLLFGNNAIYNLNNNGVIYGLYQSTGQYTDFFHNTVNVDQVTGSTGVTYAIYASGTANSLIFKNNLVNITAGGTGTKYGFYYSSTNSVTDAQRNMFYVNSTTAGIGYYGYNGGNYATLAAFQTAFPALEIGSLSNNPAFVSPATGNLTQTNVAVSNNGLNLTAILPTDILGALRPIPPTPGAFQTALPTCAGTPATPTLEGPALACAGSPFTIIQVGSSAATSITYNWQVLNTATSTWSNTGVSTFNYTNTGISASASYRVITTCTPSGVSSTSLPYLVSITPQLAGGTYTINNAAATGGTNFASFGDAISAMQCGITGSVVFNVNPATPYTEYVYLPYIKNSSSTKTIRFNGNGATVQYANTLAQRQLLILDSAAYVRLDSITFKSLDATYGWGALITNRSYNDSITRCTFNLTSVTGTSSVNSNGITFSGSNTSATTTAPVGNFTGKKCYLADNKIIGTTGNGGPYYAVTIYTADSNMIVRNTIQDFYYYGLYFYNANFNTADGNNINRATKINVTTFYGMYMSGSGEGNKIINNRIHSPKAPTAVGSGSQYGIYSFATGTAAGRLLVGNNAIYNMNNNGIIYGLYQSSPAFTDFYHNTVNLDALTGSSSTTYGIYASGTANDFNVKNNLVNITGATTGSKYGFYYSSSSSVTDAQRNMFYVNPTTGGTSYYGYNAGNYATIAAYQTAFPTQEVGSLSLNPNFIDPATGLLIQTSTPVTTNGVNLTATLPADILGTVRPINPTPGAFQTDPSVLNNGGVTSLIGPVGSYCSGQQELKVQVTNFGYNIVDSFKVYYTVNGSAPILSSFTTSPISGVLSGSNTGIVSLGTREFLPGVTYNFKFYFAAPNGVEDTYHANDSLSISTGASFTIPLNLGSDTALCPGNSIVLDAQYTPATYTWNSGATTQTITAAFAGTYGVNVLRADGCRARDTIIVTALPKPVVDLGAGDSICAGTSAILDAGNVGSSYLWNTGATTQTIAASDTGLYYVTVTNIQGCSTSDSAIVFISPTSSVDGFDFVPLFYEGFGKVKFAAINPLFVTTYDWYFGDGTAHSDLANPTHIYAAAGSYNVTLTVSNICGSYTDSLTINVAPAPTAIGNLSIEKTLSMYPNPASNMVTISLEKGSRNEIQEVLIFDVAAREIARKRNMATNSTIIDVSNITAGTYIIQIVTKDGVAIKKLNVKS